MEKMRTRIFNKMTAQEVEDYLARGGDTMFIAVGVVECHGGLPIDCEQICPEAYATLMAEKADGLAMINLPYFYPGATVISNATVHMSIRDGIDYLMKIGRSLVRQGFKKMFVISGHGPSPFTVNAFCDDFFEETLILPCHLMSAFIGRDPRENVFEEMKKTPDYTMYGAYKVMSQIDALPVNPDADPELTKRLDVNPVIEKFTSLYAKNSGFGGITYDDPRQHGGGMIFKSEEERLEICTIGEAQLKERVEKCNIVELKEALGEYQEFVQETYKKYPRIKK